MQTYIVHSPSSILRVGTGIPVPININLDHEMINLLAQVTKSQIISQFTFHLVSVAINSF